MFQKALFWECLEGAFFGSARNNCENVLYLALLCVFRAFQVTPWQRICLPVKKMQDTQVQPLGQEDALEEEMATHSSIVAWEISWREEPGGLQSVGSHRVGPGWATEHIYAYIGVWGSVQNVLLFYVNQRTLGDFIGGDHSWVNRQVFWEEVAFGMT